MQFIIHLIIEIVVFAILIAIIYRLYYELTKKMKAFDTIHEWTPLAKIAPPNLWIKTYVHYQEMCLQEDTAAWFNEQFLIADKEREELKEKAQKHADELSQMNYTIEYWQNRCNSAEVALKDLVVLKAIKDNTIATDQQKQFYETHKPYAWDQGKRHISQYWGNSPDKSDSILF